MLTVIIFAIVAISVFLLLNFFAIRPKRNGMPNELIQKTKTVKLKILSVGLVVIYAFRLFSIDVIRDSIALAPTEALAGFSSAGIALITVLRMLTNVAVIVAMIVTVLALYILCTVLEISVMWYYAVGAVVLGIFVGYAAMFGFDKFKAAWEKIKQHKE